MEITFKKIRESLTRQREIGHREGEHAFAAKLRKRYNKRAEDFYSQFAETIYYKDKDGSEIHLDIMTIWWFRWNEYAHFEKEAEERKTASFSRIREFIQKQRSIGEHLFAKRLMGNYGKRADEFYDQFADSVYYRDKDGNEIGLDIKTLWWFRWNEFASQSLITQSQPKGTKPITMADINRPGLRKILIDFLNAENINMKVYGEPEEIVDNFLKTYDK